MTWASLTIPLACLAEIAMAATSSRGRESATASVDFSAQLVPTDLLAIESHDLGGGLKAYVATYRQNHAEEPRPTEIVELFAWQGEPVYFQAGEKLAGYRGFKGQSLRSLVVEVAWSR